MKLIKPEGIMTQPFGANANPSYKGAGLKGHSGQDFSIGFKKTIKAATTGLVYSLMNMKDKNPDKYRAVFQMIDDKDFSYEVSYGHVDKSFVVEGQIVKVGEPIATEGNWGTCYVSGKLVTPEEKPSGKGTHLHFQVRKCIKVKARTSGKQYIRSSEGFLKSGKLFYEVVDYENGYNGCIDPAQFYPKELTLGSRGDDVVKLQQMLKDKGFFTYPTCTGYYGEITAKAVTDFQKANKLPLTGIWTI